jgi:hypothetical protein
MSRALAVSALSALFATVGLTGASAGVGVTKIAPGEAEAGHPFTVLDSGMGRLVDGSVAVFELDGQLVTMPLDTHKPYNTAQGRLPASIGGGSYSVYIRRPGATEFDVGPFVVRGPATVTAPFVSPTSGVIGTIFTITDQLGRMSFADVVVFSLEGQAPIDGRVVVATFSEDGTTATGIVPATLAPGGYAVTVHDEGAANAPIFNALLFTVT